MTNSFYIFRIKNLAGGNVTSGAQKIMTQKMLQVTFFCVTFAEAPLCTSTA
jgi:hypothetical protein